MSDTTEIKKRLAFVRGQLDGLVRMIDAGKDCSAVIIQFKAAKAGLEKAGALFTKNYMLECLAKKKTKTSAADLEKLLIEAFK